MTTFINLTPHAIRIRVAECTIEAAIPVESDLVIDPLRDVEGNACPARVATISGGFDKICGGVPLFKDTSYGEIVGLPAAKKDTILIVSAIVGDRIMGRTDVYKLGTGVLDNVIRSASGHIYAVTRLIQAGQ